VSETSGAEFEPNRVLDNSAGLEQLEARVIAAWLDRDGDAEKVAA